MAGQRARNGHRLTLAVFLACLVTAPALAENASRPAGEPAVTGTVAPRASDPTLGPRAQASQAQAPTPIFNPFAALLGKPASTAKLNPEQQAIINKVNKYLTTTQTLEGNFVQIGPDGKRTQGEFYIQKPGRVRFEYDPPTPIDIIADGQSVVVRDRNLATQDLYPLSQTPLRFLLADHVNLQKDTNLVAVYADDVFITVVVEEKNAIVGNSRLMIMFSAKDMQLKQWTVTDPQGYDTTVAVYNLDTTKKPDPSLFTIDYTRYPNEVH